MNGYTRRQVAGRLIALPGHDIDTDRIVPARYLRSVTFAGLGDHLFEDDRVQDPGHPFDDPRFQGASILVVGRNFGCGSSREHAPQALMRWGIRAMVGVSFGEIFFGNCTALGIPCMTAEPADVEWLMDAAVRDPGLEGVVDLEGSVVRFGARTVPARMPGGARAQLVSGTWDATGVLLEAGDAVERTAGGLPYVVGFPITQAS